MELKYIFAAICILVYIFFFEAVIQALPVLIAALLIYFFVIKRYLLGG